MSALSDLAILYIDDEPDIREVAGLSLQLDAGITVRAYESGPAALLALDADPWRPGVMLLDVMMPGMDGPEALLRLRAVPGLADTPVVFITASVQTEERTRLMALGATAVIAKPFDPMTLAAQLRSVVAAGDHGR